ncbi:MAG: sigma-54-dependent Fis family transcriptional regulator [Opitutales bacterium]|nr:sigma-54-dependent Fis family transcriptional regulator [Opitutales bacterium]
MRSIFIVDDEKHTREGLTLALSDAYDVASAANADEAFRLMQAQEFDAVITDLRMSGKDGLSVIDFAVARPERPACIMMTAYGTINSAVEAMKRGASDFLTKPINIDRLELVLANALKKRDKALAQAALNAEKIGESIEPKRPRAPQAKTPEDIVGDDPSFKNLLKTALKVAPTSATVTILGETGTGKEVVAEFIHKNSPRKTSPFVAVHCAAIPENLIESELFGYEKGAFTGASARKIGKFESANGGTIFLDEIGEINPQTQVKLLRFLETKKIGRLGGVVEIPLDVRLLCATNRNLKEMVKKGEFREDLYYRLNVVELSLPPLRKRKNDIAPLVNFYIKKYALENSAGNVEISKDALEVLKNYAWPGNIRELRNFCENAVVLRSSNTIKKEDLDARFFEITDTGADSIETKTLSKKENDLLLIEKALKQTNGNKTEAAKLLGISRRTLHRHLRNLV